MSHHSLIRYRLPATGEPVPLLHIAPSKTDIERILVISPELADVLAVIITRVRGPAARCPWSPADPLERAWHPPSPLLLQRRAGTETAFRAAPSATCSKPRWPERGRPTPRPAAHLHPTRLQTDVHHRALLTASPAHLPGDRRSPGHQCHPRL